MKYQVKLFYWRNHRTCLIIMTHGRMDRSAVVHILNEMVEVIKPLDGCKILIDLQNAVCDFGTEDFIDLPVELEVHRQAAVGKLKLAMVATRFPEQYDRVNSLKEPVARLGIDVGVFYEEERAIDWLVEESNQRYF